MTDRSSESDTPAVTEPTQADRPHVPEAPSDSRASEPTDAADSDEKPAFIKEFFVIGHQGEKASLRENAKEAIVQKASWGYKGEHAKEKVSFLATLREAFQNEQFTETLARGLPDKVAPVVEILPSLAEFLQSEGQHAYDRGVAKVFGRGASPPDRPKSSP